MPRALVLRAKDMQSTPPQASLWSARLPTGEVRSGTIEQLSEAFRAGHLAGATPVCPSGTEDWSMLSDVLSPEVWQMRVAGGQVRSGTRKQLEEAFRAGHLAADVLVLRAGTTDWVPLGSVMARSQMPPPPSFPPQPRQSVAAPPPVAPPPVVAPPAAPAPPEPELPAPPALSAEPPQVQAAPQVQASVVAEPAPASDEQGMPSPPASITAVDEARYQVELTGSQLEAAVLAGVLGADPLVMAPGTDRWVRLSELRRAQMDSQDTQDAAAS